MRLTRRGRVIAALLAAAAALAILNAAASYGTGKMCRAAIDGHNASSVEKYCGSR